MTPKQTYETIQTICKEAAAKTLSSSSLESFLAMDIKSQILGLKVFVYTGHEFEALKVLEQLETMLASLPTSD